MKEIFDYCCLCDEPIIRKKDYTREHYVPKSRTTKDIWIQPYNIKPAIKIVNNIKGNLLPCEWEEQKYYLTYKALYTYKLNNFERSFLETIVYKFSQQMKQEVCNKCILNKLNQCEYK